MGAKKRGGGDGGGEEPKRPKSEAAEAGKLAFGDFGQKPIENDAEDGSEAGAYTRPLLSLSRVCDKGNTLHTPNTPLTHTQHGLQEPLHTPPVPYTALKLSWKVDECKPLFRGCVGRRGRRRRRGGGVGGRGLHSTTSELDLSAFYVIRGARRGCVAPVKGVLGGV
jgi:hypothetical protein